jgi:methylglyoxal reductase
VAWTVANGAVSVALCGARTAVQAVDNAGAGRVVLDDDGLRAIDAASQRHLLDLG